MHGETNALLQAAKRGVATDGATMYLTHNPCRICYLNMIQAGVLNVVFDEIYKPVDYLKYIMEWPTPEHAQSLVRQYVKT
jgi:dCMP deaminase